MCVCVSVTDFVFECPFVLYGLEGSLMGPVSVPGGSWEDLKIMAGLKKVCHPDTMWPPISSGQLARIKKRFGQGILISGEL